MFGRRWLRRLAPAGLALILAVFPAGRAAAAPCTAITCYRYYADITITAWHDPSLAVFPGSVHYYTVRVTNTGWRTGGSSAPRPGLGPDSGDVYVVFHPSSPEEYPVARADYSGYVFTGAPFRCYGYLGNGLVCQTESIPNGTTSQFTVAFQAPRTVGYHTTAIYADSYGWTEYDENNNSLTLQYQVGYLA